VGGQYLLVQPGANPVLYVTRTGTDNKPDGGDEGGSDRGILEIINNYVTNIPGYPFISGTSNSSAANSTDEKPTDKPSTEKAEKVRAPRFIGYTEAIVYRNK
jgi:hypothetical protein